MEKIYSEKDTITRNFRHVTKGYYIECECCFCGSTAVFFGEKRQEVLKQMTSEGWRDINSDDFQTMGHYCGCDYQES
jgi:hypothetical protein